MSTTLASVVRRMATVLRQARVALVLAAAALCLVAAMPAQAGTDWPMFGYDVSHDGYNPAESAIGAANAGQLALKWSYNTLIYKKSLGIMPLVSRFFAQPVVASGVTVGSRTTDIVLVGELSGLFFALDGNAPTAAGSMIWTRQIPAAKSNCSDIPNNDGIMSTAAVDRGANGGRGAVYVASNGLAYAWDLATGATVPGWPEGGLVLGQLNPTRDGFIYSGLTLFNGQLYITNAGSCDTPPYHGAVTIVNPATVQVTRQWFVAGGSSTVPTVNGGGIWGPGGVSIDPSPTTGGLFTATGNPIPLGPAYVVPYVLSVLEAPLDLSTVNWSYVPSNLGGDTDFGSTPVPFRPTACANRMAATPRKTGQLFIFQITGTPPQLAATQTLAVSKGVEWGFGAIAFDPTTQLVLLTSPNTGAPPYLTGLIALKVSKTCNLSLAWQTDTAPGGGQIAAPGTFLTTVTAANGVAYFGVGYSLLGASSPFGIYAVAEQTANGVTAGQVLWHSPDITNVIYQPPVVVNGHVYAAASDGRIRAYGLPADP